MQIKSFLRQKVDELEVSLLEDWGEYKDLPEEVRHQVNLLREMDNEMEQRNL